MNYISIQTIPTIKNTAYETQELHYINFTDNLKIHQLVAYKSLSHWTF